MPLAFKRGASSISSEDNLTLSQKSKALKLLYPILFKQLVPRAGKASRLVNYLPFTTSLRNCCCRIDWLVRLILIGGWVWRDLGVVNVRHVVPSGLRLRVPTQNLVRLRFRLLSLRSPKVSNLLDSITRHVVANVRHVVASGLRLRVPTLPPHKSTAAFITNSS